MSQVLTVPTHFEDLSQLSDGFVDRVEQDTLILYGPVPYEDGEEIDFSVLLADGTPAIEGSGRVRAAVDGGDERVPETRYDVVVEALKLQDQYDGVFESLVSARNGVSESEDSGSDTIADSGGAADLFGDGYVDVDTDAELNADVELGAGPPVVDAGLDAAAGTETNAETSASEVSDVASALNGDAESAAAYSMPPDESGAAESPDGASDSDFAEIGDSDEQALGESNPGIPMPSVAPPPDLPEPPHLRLERGPEGLTRPSLARGNQLVVEATGEHDDEWSDEPAAVEAVEPTPRAPALFSYDNGLPIPERPPLPGASANVHAVEHSEDDLEHDAPSVEYDDRSEDG